MCTTDEYKALLAHGDTGDKSPNDTAEILEIEYK